MKRIYSKTTLYLQGTHVFVERWSTKKKENRKGTLLCVHGFLSSSYSFHKLIPHIPTSYEVICLDLPGFGLSGKSKRFHYELNNYANLVTELITLFNLTNVTLIGHSMGGQIALRIASNHPELIDSLVLLAPSAYFHQVKKIIYAFSFLPLLPHILYRWGHKKDYRLFIEQLMYQKKVLTQEAVESYSKPFTEFAFYEALLCLVRQREGDLTEKALHRIRQPVLIIWGNEDTLIPVSSAYKLKQDLPHASLEIVKKTGHLIPEEQPKITAHHIKTFLS